MEKITARDAETTAREFIGERHLKIKRVLLRRVEKKDDAWLIEGTVWFKRLRLFTTKKTFRLQIDTETGEVTSYEKTRRFTRTFCAR